MFIFDLPSNPFQSASLFCSRIKVSFIYIPLVKTFEPGHSILCELFNFGLQLFTLHIKVIHGPNPWYELARISTADPVHQSTTDRAEIIGHFIAGCNGLALGVSGELVLTSYVGGGSFVDDEVGCERRGVDFVVVGTVTDEGGDKVWSLDRLKLIS